ncbi:hypothetical protein D9758_007746 [Tetrapyrgos nigripes]|uniref:Uncharacterized protein n=1 Tax=Tetrapyrgos nigripes TaxID=182062 RepID=A0A8H5G541_9AGAR|nr:hypothetical protein D9758_007746 [Tetrapyrgos nigripes]
MVIANMFYIPLGIMFGTDLTTAGYIRKSLIATYLGNIVGAAIVWLPAVYFYLGDYDADGLRDAEQGNNGNDASRKESRRRSSATMTNLSAEK